MAEPLQYRTAENTPRPGMPIALKCGLVGIILWALIPIRVVLERFVFMAFRTPLFSPAWRVLHQADMSGPLFVVSALVAYLVASAMRWRGRDLIFWFVALTLIIALTGDILVRRFNLLSLPILVYFLTIPFLGLVGLAVGISEARTGRDRRGEAIAGAVLCGFSLFLSAGDLALIIWAISSL